MEKMCCEGIAKAYINEPIKDIRKLEGGHINSSFLVLAKESYVLQKLNRGLYADDTDLLEDNYLQYKKACEIYQGSWYCPEWIKDKENSYFHTGDNGEIWRMYRYIPSDRDGAGSLPLNTYEIGKGLGRLHGILRKCEDIKTIRSTAGLHDLKYHYGEYLKQAGSERERIAGLDEFIENNIESMLSIAVPANDVIHGDAKLSNMISKDGRVVGFIDLDTIMTGSVYDDLADCARSCCLDEDGPADDDRLKDLITGYEQGAGIIFGKDRIMLLKRNLEKNIFMLGIRYYTDHLSGAGYFAEDHRGQNLEKAVKLLKKYGWTGQ